jgi:hypothetical protein
MFFTEPSQYAPAVGKLSDAITFRHFEPEMRYLILKVG